MKTNHTSAITISLIIVLVLVLAYAIFIQPTASAQTTGTAALVLQATPTPPAEDKSVIGSTDGILIMGFVITLLVTLPLLFRKKGK